MARATPAAICSRRVVAVPIGLPGRLAPGS
jgi:hypothetical protein